jgi:hypothetical protein
MLVLAVWASTDVGLSLVKVIEIGVSNEEVLLRNEAVMIGFVEFLVAFELFLFTFFCLINTLYSSKTQQKNIYKLLLRAIKR